MDFEFRLMKPTEIEPVSDLVAETFSAREPLAVCLGLSKGDVFSLVKALLQTERIRRTCVALINGRIEGALVSESMVDVEPKIDPDVAAKFAPLFGFLGHLDSFVPESLKNNPEALFRQFMIAVRSSARGHSLGRQLVAFSNVAAKDSGFVASMAEVTGQTSRHIFANQCGYTSLKDVVYSDLPASVPFSRLKGADRCSLVIKSLL